MTAVIDIETKTFGMPDINHDELVLVGIKPLNQPSKVFYYPRDINAIREEVRKHHVLIGYNIKDYDIPILERFGINLKRFILCDLLQTMRRRDGYFPQEFPDKSLRTVLEVLGLPPKTETPFSIFNKPIDEWTDEEKAQSEAYLHNDLAIEENLYHYLDDYFKDWKDWLQPNDVDNQRHLNTTDGVYTYKAICKLTGMREEYNEYVPKEERHSGLTGGLVVEPAGEHYTGHIVCLDFNSMYPHAFIQGNLYSHQCNCCLPDEKWRGNSLFPVRGAYCTKQRGKIETALQQLYALRMEYKRKGDKRQAAIKIMINTIYGISGSPAFKNVYNLNTANDCTMIGRNALKFARAKLEEAGYDVIYSDTDSAYIVDKHGDIERVKAVAATIVDLLKTHFPFPADTFKIGIDAEIDNIWFFKQGTHMKKKHYIYTTKDHKIEIKGLPIIKRDRSDIGNVLLEETIKPMLLYGTLKLPMLEWVKIIKQKLSENLSLAGRWFFLKAPESYKENTCLPALLATKYGPGKHFLIPNKKYGVGKGTRYCTMEEFTSQNLSVGDIILNKTYGELAEFTDGEWPKETVVKTPKRKVKVQTSLFAFGGA